MRALKMRARFSRSLSPERVSEDARLRAAEVERKAKRYNKERGPEVQLPHSVSYVDCYFDDEGVERPPSGRSAELRKSNDEEDAFVETASVSHNKTTAPKKEGLLVTMKMRCSKLLSSRSSVPVDVSKKPNLLERIRSRFIPSRPRPQSRQENDGDHAIPRASSDHVSFDSVCTR
eukprot:TRINITY_DN10652_c0_g1_i1.p1 TRINITY_DN10652_c0_g1~~TRINITY_DN10652_c0_g1_i1.p1  ORF type:complete len:175 (-),score=23.47 TRINITY_DN10652_c0_g1_i1:142-666(-)